MSFLFSVFAVDFGAGLASFLATGLAEAPICSAPELADAVARSESPVFEDLPEDVCPESDLAAV